MRVKRLAEMREWVRRRARRRREKHAVVLMYHRVATAAVDPWNLCVDPLNFDAQIRKLVRHFDVVPLSRLRDHLRDRGRGRPVAAITFDDGYADNLCNALPVLERHGAPATVFVATGFIGQRKAFWWDRLAEILLVPGRLPVELQIRAGRGSISVRDTALGMEGACGARARRRLHDRLWQRLSVCQDTERDATLAGLAEWAGCDEAADPLALPLDEPQLRELSAGGLVDVGAHSVTHPLISGLTAAQKRFEIQQSRADCRRMLGHDPACFSFPNGDHDPESLSIVRQAGFGVACTSRPDLAWESADALATPRIFVANQTGAALMRRLRWFWLA